MAPALSPQLATLDVEHQNVSINSVGFSHRDLPGITSKRGDVLLYPVEGEPF